MVYEGHPEILALMETLQYLKNNKGSCIYEELDDYIEIKWLTWGLIENDQKNERYRLTSAGEKELDRLTRLIASDYKPNLGNPNK